MKERWILFYDGACPLCFRSKSWLFEAVDKNIKLTAVDLNSNIAKQKGYSTKSIVLETKTQTFTSHHAFLKLLSKTKYKFFTNIYFKPIFIFLYFVVSKNRKIVNKLIVL
jgi:predicted DCC family thiol-disulfide oxidoreductase YuxK